MKKRIITDTLPSNEKLNSRYLDLEALAEVEDHLVALSSISVFELIITPDIKNENVFGSLEQLRLA